MEQTSIAKLLSVHCNKQCFSAIFYFFNFCDFLFTSLSNIGSISSLEGKFLLSKGANSLTVNPSRESYCCGFVA